MPIKRKSALGVSLKTTLGLVLLTAGFLATLGTLLGFLGSFWWAFDVLASFRLQYAIVLLVTGLLYGVLLARGASWLFIAAALVNIAVLVPLYLRTPVAAESDAGITIVSFNVQAINQERAQVMDWVDNSDADLVFLLESSEDWDDVFAQSRYRVLNELPVDRRYGITLLGRQPVEVELQRLGRAREPVLRVRTAIDDQEVVVYALHARPPTTEADAEHHAEVLEEVADWAAAETSPVVVIGDLNATPWAHSFQTLASRADLVNSAEGYGIQPTWPSDLPFGLNLPIDHMLHSPMLTTTAREIGPDLGSDHRPLTVTVGVAAS